jgi:hypothetical protein
MSKHSGSPSSDLRFCSCRMCRSGRRSTWGNFIIKYARRKQRRMIKRLLKQGNYDIPIRYSVPYTD